MQFSQAVRLGSCDIVDSMLELGYTPQPKDIHIACHTGNVDMLTRFLKYDLHLRKCLFIVIENGHSHLLDHLYAAGVDINSGNRNKNTALHHVRDEICCKWLLDMGARQLPNREGHSPLHQACKRRNSKVVKLLLDNDISTINNNDRYEGTPLHCACRCRHGNPEIVELLLNYGAQQLPEYNKNTPLMLACINNNYDIVNLLLTHGAQQVANDRSWTPLHYTCKYEYHHITQLLLQHGAVQTGDNNGIFPIHIAASKCLENVQLLVQYSSSSSNSSSDCNSSSSSNSNLNFGCVNVVDNRGDTPLHYACRENKLYIVDFLLKNGAVQKANYAGDIPLDISFAEYKIKQAELLLKNDSGSVNRVDEYGNTLLHKYYNRIDVVKLLLHYGAKQIKNKDGITPLALARENKWINLEISELMLKYQTLAIL